jgi:dihydrofolate reductase
MLTYSAQASLDGYVADRDGRWSWAFPSEELHSFLNDRDRRHGTYLLGRRMYDVLAVWETMPTEGEPAAVRDYAELWRAKDKVVYSRSLDEPRTARTRIERQFDPTAVRTLVAAADTDVSVGGPELAAHALRAGLVEQIELYLYPAVVGGGTAALPDDLRLDLRLLDEHRFADGAVFLSYRVM